MTDNLQKYIDLHHKLQETVKDFVEDEYDKWLDSEAGIKMFDEMDDAWYVLTEEETKELYKIMEEENAD